MLNMKNRSFLKLLDYTPDEISGLINLAAELKAQKKAGIPHRMCQGKNIALIFEKTSTRTRCAFEVAAADLGMHPVYLDPSGSQIGKKESIADTARVLGRMFDGIEYRGFGQELVEALASHAGETVFVNTLLKNFLTFCLFFLILDKFRGIFCTNCQSLYMHEVKKRYANVRIPTKSALEKSPLAPTQNSLFRI